MTKTRQAEIEISKMGYSIEWKISLRGNNIVKGVNFESKESTPYETTVIKLAAKIREVYKSENSKKLFYDIPTHKTVFDSDGRTCEVY